jgi:hypothetical protein
MPAFKLSITISASNEEEARRKAKAAATVCDKLTAAQLEKLALAVKDPATVQLALAYLG